MFKLNAMLASNIDANEKDVRNVKCVLNKLGYYTPNPGIGMSKYPDRKMFSAIKEFQTDHKTQKNNIEATGTIRPGDNTVLEINRELEEFKKSEPKRYIWHSVDDEKVRDAHAAKDGGTFRWSDPGLHPGEDYNCRCWAENVSMKKNKKYHNYYDEWQRIKAIKNNEDIKIKIKENPNAEHFHPYYEKELEGINSVLEYEYKIQKASKKYKVDADQIRAIMYAENALGHQFGFNKWADKQGISSSKMPMNVRPDRWAKWPEKTYNLNNPNDNIEVGARLIGRLTEIIENSTPEKIGSMWNNTRANEVSNFGARVGRAHEEKPWKDKSAIDKMLEEKRISDVYISHRKFNT